MGIRIRPFQAEASFRILLAWHQRRIALSGSQNISIHLKPRNENCLILGGKRESVLAAAVFGASPWPEGMGWDRATPLDRSQACSHVSSVRIWSSQYLFGSQTKNLVAQVDIFAAAVKEKHY